MDNSPASDQKAVPDRPPVWDMLGTENYVKTAYGNELLRKTLSGELNALARGVFGMMDKNGFWDQTKPEVVHAQALETLKMSEAEITEDESIAMLAGIRTTMEKLEPEIKLAKHMLVVTEVAELSEGVRKHYVSDHVPEFTMEEEEVVDALVRLFDYAGKYNLRLGECFFAKMYFNGQRPYKHGKAA